MNNYDRLFYNHMAEAAAHGASCAVPLILSAINPSSVIDIGCGAGTWAKAFIDAGVKDVIGVDGEWVPDEVKVLPTENFVKANLTDPISINRKFDLCICLETAEHLPENRCFGFVSDLTALSDVIVFSAAVPFQGGTHHINEKWQSYWVGLFASFGYVGVDYLRRRIWYLNKYNTWFYAQNMLVFIRFESLKRYPVLDLEWTYQAGEPISLVHPGLLMLQQPWQKHLTVRAYFSLLPKMINKLFIAIINRLMKLQSKSADLDEVINRWHSQMK